MEKYITRDGKVYKQTIIEEEIDIAQEEYKLQAWKDALANDEREKQEYLAKLAEVDSLDIPDDYKKNMKESIIYYSGSSIKQEMVDEQEAKLAEIQNIKKSESIITKQK